MTNKLEIEINITKTTIERAVFVNGEERYRDCYTLPSFPSDDDPIRALEIFLMGEQPKSGRDRSRNSRNLINSLKNFWVVRFRKTVEFISKFLQICLK